MKKEKKVWAMTVWIAFWWLAPNQTNAQQDSIKTTSLNEIVVTATKFAKSQSETGKVLTIIDANQIEQSAGKDLSQLLNEQCGLFINGANSNPGKDKSVYLRGAKSEYTLILLDGVPLNDPSAIGGGAYDLRLIPLDQIERIEILKGNQSTLYGSNAIAGVINIITKKDGDKRVGASALLSYGNFNTRRANASLSGSAKAISYSIGGSYFKTSGISEAKDTATIKAFEKDGYDQKALNASITVKPLRGLQIEHYYRFSDFDGRYDGGPFIDNRKNQYTSNFHNAGVAADYQFKKGQVHLLYGFDKTDRTFLDSAYGFINTYRYKGRFQHGEAFFNYQLSRYFELMAGLNTQVWHMLDDATTIKNPATSLYSGYASVFIKNWKGLSAELGGRYNYHSQYGDNVTFSINPSYRIGSLVKVFANISSGFKAPSLQQLYGQWGANKNLMPETSYSTELGAQFYIRQVADIRIVAFERKTEKIIFYAFPNGYINQDEQQDKGIDVEGSLIINKKMTVRSFYSFVTGKLVTGQTAEQNNLYRIPKHTLGVNWQYQVIPQWRLNLNYKYTGRRTDLFFNNDTFLNEQTSLSAYHLVNFYSEYTIAKSGLTIFADIKNLLNQKYYEIYGYSAAPLNVTAGIQARL